MSHLDVLPSFQPFLLQSCLKDAFFPISQPSICQTLYFGWARGIENDGEHLDFALYLGNQQGYDRKLNIFR